MTSLFDAYSLKARVAPAVLLFLPCFLALSSWMPESKLPSVAIFGLTGNVVLGFFAAERVRDEAKRKQDVLWRSWGGKPTTQLLRWRNQDVSQEIKLTWRKCVESFTDKRLPTKAKETSDPQAADNAYDNAVLILRESTRESDGKNLVFKENVGYGFRRNLWAVKPAGLALSILSTLACFARTFITCLNGDSLESHVGVALLVCATFVACWWCGVTTNWVRTAAFDYASTLFNRAITKTLSTQPSP